MAFFWMGGIRVDCFDSIHPKREILVAVKDGGGRTSRQNKRIKELHG